MHKVQPNYDYGNDNDDENEANVNLLNGILKNKNNEPNFLS